MASLAITAIITLLIIAQFYLKNSVIRSLSMVFTGVFGVLVAFNFFEPAAAFLLGKGWLPAQAQALCFVLLFGLGFGIPFYLTTFITGDAIDFGKAIKGIISVVCGSVFGLLVSGVVLIFLSLMPLPGWLPYARFSPESLNPGNSKAAVIPADTMTVALANLVSRGAMDSGNPFGFVNADFLDKIHINRLNKNECGPVAAKGSVRIPADGVKLDENNNRLLLTVEMSTASVQNGGAGGETGLAIMPAQVRLIYENTDTHVLYPSAALTRSQTFTDNLNQGQIITFTREDIEGGYARIQLAYELNQIPDNAILQFRNNVFVKVPKPKPAE